MLNICIHILRIQSLTVFVVCLAVNIRSVESICSVNCRFGDDYCFADGSDCLYGCIDGYVGQGCLKQCTILNCKSCYLSQDNKELCSVCSDGHYGDNCEHLCSNNCIGKECDRHGNCVFGCNFSWLGERCDKQNCTFENCVKCHHSRYNSYCSQCERGMFWNPAYGECRDCSSNCVGGAAACNTTTGNCAACKENFYGDNCDKYCSIANCFRCTDVYYGINKRTVCDVCKDGWYKDDYVCKPCSQYCKGGLHFCDKNNGRCRNGCLEGSGMFGLSCNRTCTFQNCKQCNLTIYNTEICGTCNPGYFWKSSLKSCEPCPSTCKSGCDTNTGECVGGCVDGYYGKKCSGECGRCANATTCNSQYGHCPGDCEPGWYGSFCQSTCPVHCSSCEGFQNNECDSCEAGWHGPTCDIPCNENCQRSNFNNYLYCDKVTGKCRDGCIPGYSGDYCNIVCSQHCFAQTCNPQNAECTFGCNQNYYGKRCDKKCPENCRTGCDMYRGQCIDGECKIGFFGENCENACSKTCLYGACSTESNGDCVSGCLDGFYGSKCTRNCSKHCKDKKCYQGTGFCMRGCESGYYGSQCDATCPSKCLLGCNQNSGFCIDCANGYYGDRCYLSCSTNCFNASCDQTTARCKEGCMEGKYGNNCMEDCRKGYYGRNCQYKCGNCKDGTCSSTNGTCLSGCKSDWTGVKCLKKSLSVKIHTADNSDKSTIAISSSATVGVLLTVTVIAAVAICYRRENSHGVCVYRRSKDRSGQGSHRTNAKLSADNSPNQSTAFSTIRNISQTMIIDPADLQIKETIGHGHFLACKSASFHQKRAELIVMVKILNKETQKHRRQEFYHEIEIMNSISHHENILSFIGICENNSFIHSVFEFCSSGNLETYMQNLRKTTNDSVADIVSLCYIELVTFVIGVIEGLDHLHQNQIIHRHVSSENVFLDKNCTAKLTGFNFALRCSVDELEAGFVKARKLPNVVSWWMPPEALRCDTYSQMSDIWGIGMLLWEVITLGTNDKYQRSISDPKQRSPQTSPVRPDSSRKIPSSDGSPGHCARNLFTFPDSDNPSRDKAERSSPRRSLDNRDVDRITRDEAESSSPPRRHDNRAVDRNTRDEAESSSPPRRHDNRAVDRYTRDEADSSSPHRHHDNRAVDRNTRHEADGYPVVVEVSGNAHSQSILNDLSKPFNTDSNPSSPERQSNLHSSNSPNRRRSSPHERKISPTLPSGCDTFLAKCIRKCWNDNPGRRPSCETLKNLLSESLGRRQTSDSLIVSTAV